MNLMKNTNWGARALAMLLVAMFATVSLAYADDNRRAFDGKGGKDGKGWQQSDERHAERMDRMAEKLGLSDAQKKEVEAVFESSRDKMRESHEQMRDLRKQMHALDPSEGNYMKEVSKLARRTGELMENQIIERARTRQAVHQVLTPEQRETAKKLREERRERMQDRRDERRERRMGRDDR